MGEFLLNAFERRTERERAFRFKGRELPEPNAGFRFGVQGEKP